MPTILVVDDSATTRSLVASYLTDWEGVEVVEAASGFEALRVLPARTGGPRGAPGWILAVLASRFLKGLAFPPVAALIFAVTAQREATAREARSADVTAASLRLEKLVVDMETGLRGLTLTGERVFLEPYTQAINALPAHLAALQSLVADDPVQRRRAQQVEERIREYLDFVQPLVAGVDVRGERDQ